jgi:TonB family protein
MKKVAHLLLLVLLLPLGVGGLLYKTMPSFRDWVNRKAAGQYPPVPHAQSTPTPARLPLSLLLDAALPAFPPEAAMNRAIYKPAPVYPQAARGASGIVIVHVRVDEKGAVNSASLVRGDPTLGQAAIEAVRTWRFRPYIPSSTGNPVSFGSDLPFTFSAR